MDKSIWYVVGLRNSRPFGMPFNRISYSYYNYTILCCLAITVTKVSSYCLRNIMNIVHARMVMALSKKVKVHFGILLKCLKFTAA